MKRFACGDVIPGCERTFEAETDVHILALVARHAIEDHGLENLDPWTEHLVETHTYDA